MWTHVWQVSGVQGEEIWLDNSAFEEGRADRKLQALEM